MNIEYTYNIYQGYNIEVRTLVAYATIETKFQIGKNLPIVR